MRLTSIRAVNVKSIADSGVIPLDQINLLVGPNNAGKSSLLQALYTFQTSGPATGDLLRTGAKEYQVDLTVVDAVNNPWDAAANQDETPVYLRFTPGQPIEVAFAGNAVGLIHDHDPKAFFYPFLAKRKVNAFDRQQTRNSATVVGPTMQTLPSRVQRVSNQDYPGSDSYRNACKAILGFVPHIVDTPDGDHIGRWVNADEGISIEQMGEGVPSLVGFLASLSYASGKCFIIEEPENDLHPTALKQLLDLIVESSASNQFLISTHSNIVVRHLGSAPGGQIIKVTSHLDSLRIDTSGFSVLDPTPSARIGLLRELGYELSDFDLYDGWLILEESSAELIIRRYLLKWFAPKLVGRLRTVGANGTSDVEPRFAEFRRLFTFVHLEEQYRHRAWVLVDGDASGRTLVEKLQHAYGKDWPDDHFQNLSEECFEMYYPDEFRTQVENTLGMPRSRAKEEAKHQLLDDVAKWIDDNEAHARKAFAESAREVIEHLLTIEAQLIGQ